MQPFSVKIDEYILSPNKALQPRKGLLFWLVYCTICKAKINKQGTWQGALFKEIEMMLDSNDTTIDNQEEPIPGFSMEESIALGLV